MSSTYIPPKRKTKVVFVQLGSPEAPTPKALRKYLRKFLGDPRVIDINPWIWKIILNGFVLPFRPAKSAKLYERIWDGSSFPLITNTANFTDNIRKELKDIISKGGGKASSSISKNTSFILAGDKMGPSKKEKAIELNIEMIGEEEFIKRYLST